MPQQGEDAGQATAVEDEVAALQALAAGGDDEASAGLGVSSSARLASVHVVTEEEAAAQRFSIHDVVLPVPGSSVKYPQHATADVYKEVRRGERMATTLHERDCWLVCLAWHVCSGTLFSCFCMCFLSV